MSTSPDPERDGSEPSVRRRRAQIARVVALAAVLAAVVLGVSVDRWFLAPSSPAVRQPVAARGSASRGAELTLAYISDPRFVRARAVLLRSLSARLQALPAPARRKVLQSLATIRQSMQTIQQALGREPGNALLQEMLIETYQDEMLMLSTVQETSGGA